MITEIDIIPFHGSNLHVLQRDGQPWVVLKPAFTAIGVDPDAQIRKIQKQAWSCTVTTTVQLDHQARKMIVADLRTFLMALATIPASRVLPAARPLLEAYQSEAADVIEAYFNRGMAQINPRVEPEQIPAVVHEAVLGYRSAREQMLAEDELERAASARVSAEQVRLIELAVSSGLIDPQWAKTKTQVVLARGLGETPQIKTEELPLYVEDFMKSKGVPRSKISRFSGAFGKKILDRAAFENSPVPGKRVQELPNGHVREITAWTKEHLPMFERAWTSSGYADDSRLKA